MVAGGGCVSSRGMLESVDFALMQAKKEPRITQKNAVPIKVATGRNYKSPSYDQSKWEKHLLHSHSRSGERKRNKNPDEADWGVSLKPIRNRSRSRGETPKRERGLGDHSRSPRSLLRNKNGVHSRSSDDMKSVNIKPSEKMRSFEQRSRESSVVLSKTRKITPSRSRILEKRNPLLRSRSRGRAREEYQESAKGGSRQGPDEDDRPTSEMKNRHYRKRSQSNHRGESARRSPPPDRDAYFSARTEGRSDEEDRHQRFLEATNLREGPPNKTKQKEPLEASFDELSTVEYEHQVANIHGEGKETNWDSPRFSSASRVFQGLDPVERFRDNDGIGSPPQPQHEPKVKTITNWGISEMVSDLSCSSAGLHQEQMRPQASRVAQGAKRTFSFVTEKLQKTLLDAKNQLYPEESIHEAPTAESDTEEPQATPRNEKQELQKQKTWQKAAVSHKPRLNIEEVDHESAKTTSWRSIQHAASKKSTARGSPSCAVHTQARRRSRSPDAMRSYHDSRSRAQLTAKKLKNFSSQQTERSYSPAAEIKTPVILRKANSFGAIKTSSLMKTSQRAEEKSLVRSRSSTGLSIRDRLLVNLRVDPFSISSRESHSTDSKNIESLSKLRRPRSLTPTRKPMDRSLSPTPMKAKVKPEETKRSRSITPSRLFGFGRRKQQSEKVPQESIELVDIAEERLRLIQEKRMIEEKLAAIQQSSVGENSDISLAQDPFRNLDRSGRDSVRTSSPSASPSSITRIRPKKSAVEKLLSSFGGKSKKKLHNSSTPFNKDGIDVFTRSRSKSPRLSISQRWFGGHREDVPHRTKYEVHHGSSTTCAKYQQPSSRTGSHRDRILFGASTTSRLSRNEVSSTGSSQDQSSASSKLVQHMTTFDSLMKSIENDKQTGIVPHAEFAAVELGDEEHAITTHTVLVNPSAIQRELAGTPVETAEKPQPVSSRLLNRSQSRLLETSKKPGSRDELEMTPSFAHKIPKGAYMI